MYHLSSDFTTFNSSLRWEIVNVYASSHMLFVLRHNKTYTTAKRNDSYDKQAGILFIQHVRNSVSS